MDEIDEKLRKLTARQVEIEKKRLVQNKPPFLDIESEAINAQIARLEHDKNQYMKLIQSTSKRPSPEKDYSNTPFYSQTLRSWTFEYPIDQMGLYWALFFATRRVSKAVWNEWNRRKAVEIFKKGKESVSPGKFDFHMHNSGLESEAQLGRYVPFRGYFAIGQAVGVAGLILVGFTFFVHLKNQTPRL
jgi:hypothetical protein